MSTALRAFLMLKVNEDWKISVHRDLEDLLSIWTDRPEPEDVAAVIHLGFERPSARAFDELVDLYPGKALLTAAARFGLPTGFEASSSPVAMIDSLPVYLAVRGWGYLLDPASINSGRLPISPTLDRRSYGWVNQFLTENPNFSRDFSTADIFEDEDYLAKEKNLEPLLRKTAGIYRLRVLTVGDEDDPCKFAAAAPPWLAERELSTVDFRVRVANVLKTLNLTHVKDLSRYTVSKLTSTQNFGRKSVGDLLSGLEAALQQGAIESHTHTPTGLIYDAEASLLDSITLSLQRLPERAREIVQRRMGIRQQQQTLQEVGDYFGVTRERIRQIEAKTVARLVRNEVWDDVLTEKLSKLLTQRPSPLPLRGIDAADPWFEGVGENGEVLKYLLQNVSGAAKIVNISGIEYLGLLSQDDWDKALSSSRLFLASSVEGDLSIEECKATVGAILPECAREFSELLWENAAEHCHFVSRDGREMLVGNGRGAEHLVYAILAESPTPIHYTQIAEIAERKSDREFDIRRIHNAAASVGYLFNLGTYGLERHLPVSEEELQGLADAAEDIVQEGPADRQWHANEIFAELIDSGAAHADVTSKYVLDIALKKSGRLEDLGRLVWRKGSQLPSDNAYRIDIRQAVVAILRDAGGPLPMKEIRARVEGMRGVDRLFQLHIADPIVRLGPSVFGLNDRDVSLKRDRQGAVLDSIVKWLGARGKGVHYSELEDAPQLKQLGITVATLFSLASNDTRMRVSSGRYLYLEEWGEPRRESLGQSVKRVITDARRPLTMEEIILQVSGALGRNPDRPAVINSLRAIEAKYDELLKKWFLPQKSEVPVETP